VKRLLSLLGLALLACVPMTAHTADAEKKAEPFTLKDGDRVVLLGNTLIEREQRYGYWELALTARFPDKNIQFRNLGWSGDTVWGQARAGFGDQAAGFKHLKEHVASLKPTVIIVGYGNNEAFDGEDGLPHCLDGLNKLLDALAENKSRIVLLSPLPQEDMGRPLPDPTEQNKNIRLYRDATKKVADKRGYAFVDLETLLPFRVGPNASQLPLTDNGIHLKPFGYWWSSFALARALGIPFTPWRIDVDVEKGKTEAQAAKLVADKDSPLRFKLIDDTLPPMYEKGAVTSPNISENQRIVRVRGLAAGDYTLTIDGQKVATEPAKKWAEGVYLHDGPEFDQAEKLRAAIIEKNRLYFHRWRPQNETYLFGFRKYEQGQNAIEIPKFDPLVADKEKEIAKLRVPVEHTYELKRAPAGGDKE
jgi:hypothetical protein